MRNQRLTTVALALSVLSLSYAAWLHHRMDSALERREQELVRHWTPQMRALYADMLPATNGLPAKPKTFEELFGPLFRLLDKMGAPDVEKMEPAKPGEKTK